MYLGGKSRIAKAIAAVINAERGAGLLWDPFCGGLATAAALGGEIVCSDAHAGLINLYRALQADPGFLDWMPELDAEGYAFAKGLPDTDPVKAFIGFGLSFGGMWFRGLAGPRVTGGREYSMLESSRRSVKRDIAALHTARFEHLDFLATPLPAGVTHVYCDPPYKDTATYDGVAPFDYTKFLGRVEELARSGVVVWVSEYEFPMGCLVWERPRNGSGLAAGNRMERLYKVGP